MQGFSHRKLLPNRLTPRSEPRIPWGLLWAMGRPEIRKPLPKYGPWTVAPIGVSRFMEMPDGECMSFKMGIHTGAISELVLGIA